MKELERGCDLGDSSPTWRARMMHMWLILWLGGVPLHCHGSEGEKEVADPRVEHVLRAVQVHDPVEQRALPLRLDVRHLAADSAGRGADEHNPQRRLAPSQTGRPPSCWSRCHRHRRHLHSAGCSIQGGGADSRETDAVLGGDSTHLKAAAHPPLRPQPQRQSLHGHWSAPTVAWPDALQRAPVLAGATAAPAALHGALGSSLRLLVSCGKPLVISRGMRIPNAPCRIAHLHWRRGLNRRQAALEVEEERPHRCSRQRVAQQRHRIYRRAAGVEMAVASERDFTGRDETELPHLGAEALGPAAAALRGRAAAGAAGTLWRGTDESVAAAPAAGPLIGALGAGAGAG